MMIFATMDARVTPAVMSAYTEYRRAQGRNATRAHAHLRHNLPHDHRLSCKTGDGSMITDADLMHHMATKRVRRPVQVYSNLDRTAHRILSVR